MSHSTTIVFENRSVWVFDEARGIWMKYLIEAVMRRASREPRPWMADELDSWRVTASIGDFAWTIADDKTLTGAQVREFLGVAEEACETLTSEPPLSLAEVRTWSLADDLPLVQRDIWDDPIDTAPIVELGRAVIDLVAGTLRDPPAGTMWFFGWPGGRTTIPRQ